MELQLFFIVAIVNSAYFLWAVVLQILKIVKFLPSQSPLMNWYIPKEGIWFYISSVCLIIFVINFFKKIWILYPKKSV